MQANDHRRQDIAASRAVWDDLAAKARGLHCPEHFVEPWRVVVSGNAPGRMRLQISGCCARLQEVVNAMIRSDPRISGGR